MTPKFKTTKQRECAKKKMESLFEELKTTANEEGLIGPITLYKSGETWDLTRSWHKLEFSPDGDLTWSKNIPCPDSWGGNVWTTKNVPESEVVDCLLAHATFDEIRELIAKLKAKV